MNLCWADLTGVSCGMKVVYRGKYKGKKYQKI